MAPELAERHKRIREQVYFNAGMPAEAVVELLERAGFVDIVVDRNLWDIHLAQARKMPFWRGAERLASDRFAIRATKRQGPGPGRPGPAKVEPGVASPASART